jgi:cytochrome c oxidase subunit 2
MNSLFPEEASHGAGAVDDLYFVLLGLSGFFVLAVAGPLVLFCVKYRRGAVADRSRPVTGSLRLELAWMLGPLVLGSGLFAWGAVLYVENQRPPAEALEVHVVAKQWMWKLQHPGGRREINELHVPVGRQVRLLMTSQDVIHSFSVPAFRLKQDVVPGRYTGMWFVPNRPGAYALYCAEYCGTDHSRMTGRVIVQTEADYARWSREGEQLEPVAAAGRRLFLEAGCSACHAGHSVVSAPPLAGLFGRTIHLTGGGTLVADDNYVRDSIVNPGARVVAGYESVMPAYTQLSEEELMEIGAYLKSLNADAPPPESEDPVP